MTEADEVLAAANAGSLVGGPRRYRKKPVVVEAMRVGDDPDQIVEVIRWCGGSAVGEVDGYERAVVAIDTPEGRMVANPGDYVIKGVQGEFYPCKADIFDATYEPA